MGSHIRFLLRFLLFVVYLGLFVAVFETETPLAKADKGRAANAKD